MCNEINKILKKLLLQSYYIIIIFMQIKVITATFLGW